LLADDGGGEIDLVCGSDDGEIQGAGLANVKFKVPV
jgi:hypothetical protein